MRKNNIKIVLLMLTIMSYFSSCQDAWPEHYSHAGEPESELRITEFIAAQTDLSIFNQMLEISGYDQVLAQSQTYTLWVPVNEALAAVDLSDSIGVTRLVTNHLARFVYTTSGDVVEKIEMKSGKKVLFERGDHPTFGGKNIIESTLTQNGLVYSIDELVPFLGNIYEYIGYTNGLDSIRKYIDNQNILVFDPINSIEVGVDGSGNSLYDSVFNNANWIFTQYGAIDNEDSIYTVLLPDNKAWENKYDSIKKYFRSSAPEAKSIEKYYTQKAIVNDLFFRNEIADMSMYDSIQTTAGNLIYQPNYLFENYTAVPASNGLMYIVDELRIKPEDSFLKEIRVEAESSIGRTNSNAEIISRNSYGSSLPISNGKYIVVEPTTTSSFSKVYVDFSLPSTLATKYNIYVVFVPSTIASETDLRPFKAVFYFQYIDENGALVSIRRNELEVENPITNPSDTTKMLVAENFEFPYSDLSLEEDATTSVVLRVQNDVSTKETVEYSRSMRIDCIILEPVVE